MLMGETENRLHMMQRHLLYGDTLFLSKKLNKLAPVRIVSLVCNAILVSEK